MKTFTSINYLDNSQSDIENKKYNPFLGISINNRKFTHEYLETFMNWGAGVAKEKTAVIVVDLIQRINNEVFDRSKPIKALEKALRKADEKREICAEVYNSLSEDVKEKVKVIEWVDVIEPEYFIHNLTLLKEEYKANPEFRADLYSITSESLGTIVNRLQESEIAALSMYYLNELPTLISGVIHEGIHYNLNVYPGPLGEGYGYLVGREYFKKLLEKVRIIEKPVFIEAYCE